MAHEQGSTLKDDSQRMKRDWDARAFENAKWYINTIKREQEDGEFDETGRHQVDALILSDLPLLTGGRDSRSLRLLEIGCGIGRMTRHLAGIFGEVHATDVSGEMVRQARARLEGVSNVSIHETDGLGFEELPDNYFDLAFSAYVFQHVPSAAVIRANIIDTLRVLTPGGIFKFQTNGTTRAAFDELDKDTWTGVSFPETEVRRLARELGAQLLGISGSGSQYCWSMLRKMLTTPKHVASSAPENPVIIFHGMADDPWIKLIPTRGDYAFVTVIVSGLNPEVADANNVLLEIGGHPVSACYVGPPGQNYKSALLTERGNVPDLLVQVNAMIPQNASGGQTSVRVLLGDGTYSQPIAVDLAESSEECHIRLVKNTHDGGTDVYASGMKSTIELLIEGLDEEAAADEVTLFIGEQRLAPDSFEFVKSKGLHRIKARLPSGLLPGATTIGLAFRSRQMVSANLDILPEQQQTG